MPRSAKSNLPKVSKHQLLLLLLGLDGPSVTAKGIGGITRLQKLLFLLWKEADIQEVESCFQFKPYKAGPYSRKLYDELELLENLALIQSEVQGEATEAEAAELEELALRFKNPWAVRRLFLLDLEIPAISLVIGAAAGLAMGVMTGVWSMDTVGPISRTVEDAAITLGAIAGYDPKDSLTWNTPVPDYRRGLDGDIHGMKIGIVT
ncbi:MAG: hypothetical protein IH897_08820, partial [Planctomycetes bacterium]|nr:hypothetical protein [Planctomycetota bacterium]